MSSDKRIDDLADGLGNKQTDSSARAEGPSPAILKRCEMKMNTYLNEQDPMIALAALEDLKSICEDNNISFNEHDQGVLRARREYVYGRED